MNPLDLNTFGKTPACLYLAYQLTQSGDPRLANRVGQSLTHFRELVRSLERANEAKAMTTHNVGSFASLLRNVADQQHAKFSAKNELVADLVRNIMVGELKSMLRRASQAKYAFKELQRNTADVPGPTMSAMLETLRPKLADYEDSINADSLIEKSLRKIERKGKISTLY